MENASKALIIAGAILISILIIAIGMYIYTSSTGSINEAIAQMDTQEVQSFNSQWANYEGTQTGSQVKALITQLIAQANTYQEEPEKVVGVYCQAKNATDITSIGYSLEANQLVENSGMGVTTKANNIKDLTNYIKSLNNLQSSIQAKHKYKVALDYDGLPIVRRIIITY